jgi:hypothetical protein
MTTPARTPLPAIEVPPELEPVYSNLARIAHSPADFVLDFAHMLPNEPKALARARVVMTPLSVKLLYRALADNLARYEAAFGEIAVNMPGGGPSLADNLFRPYQGPSDPPAKE